ncbi:Crp/Fnr family transcriptional regulator [Nostoc flagelliforme FACHB-838]|uniref:Crp/Fnr family transcriptional regulator n=2 Tax=Nostoc flagelliforme TaxID=1306274 RepID=A0ABR8DZ93_9NOSO|nr:Crp/Fnr family transcriptional regulator [Nostoc flagelliforme]MBD2534751.1 Crp/Fnr family transcriptional regulator [Nostoc flagelliforme FACHB-838]
MEVVPLEFKQHLYLRNQPIEYVYFLNYGVASMLTVLTDGSAIEVATVGNEGMVGLPVFLGADRIPGECFIQVPGYGLRMRVDAFKTHVTASSRLHDLLQRYTQGLFNQIAQSAACNRLHSIEERLCRWLLMTADRVETNSFPLTQEFLSKMLGVNRSSVSLSASVLQRAGLISYVRGQMTILDRDGLEATTCECYQVVKAEFERLVNGN